LTQARIKSLTLGAIAKGLIVLNNITTIFVLLFVFFGCQSKDSKQTQQQFNPEMKDRFNSNLVIDHQINQRDTIFQTKGQPFEESLGHYFPDHYIFYSAKYIRSFEFFPERNEMLVNITGNPDTVGNNYFCQDIFLSKDTVVFVCPIEGIGNLKFCGSFSKWNSDGSTTRFTKKMQGFPNYLSGTVVIYKDSTILYSQQHNFSHVGPETGE